MSKTETNSLIRVLAESDLSSYSSTKDFILLLKPRVMSLVIFTGCVGMKIAPGTIHPVIAFIAILCISIGSGAAGAINMWFDRDIDSVMSRTKNRPIPRGTIDPTEALHFGMFLAFLAMITMGLFVNLIAAAMLGFAILFYVLIYTIWLKRKTPQNIVIGGAAGAIPPIIGWSAVTGSIDIQPLILFLIIFMWTPPHFWSLSIYNSNDYRIANIPMMPIARGVKSTQKQIFIYSLLLFLTTLIPYFIKMSGLFYLTIASFSGLIFLWYTYKLYSDTSYSLKTFKYSIIYLFLLFLGILLDKIILNF